MGTGAVAQEPNEYLLDDGTKLSVRADVARVSRTSLHDAEGDRIYLAEPKPIVDVMPPGAAESR